jgi:hypothetical protein
MLILIKSISNGKGIDVVLNTRLDFIEATVLICAKNARFVEIFGVQKGSIEQEHKSYHIINKLMHLWMLLHIINRLRDFQN